jgi:C-terminal processing protease CtpA/Prc
MLEREVYLKESLRPRSGIVAVIWPIVCFAILSLAPLAYANEQFGGLGMMVAQLYDDEVENGRGDVVVLGVLPKSPAAKAGIKAGDSITHIDGEAVSGKTFDEIVTGELRGPIGKLSKLTIKRPLKDKPMLIVLKRIRITSPLEAR